MTVAPPTVNGTTTRRRVRRDVLVEMGAGGGGGSSSGLSILLNTRGTSSGPGPESRLLLKRVSGGRGGHPPGMGP